MGTKVNTKNDNDPAYGAAVLTLHDTNELAVYSRAIYVGGTGNLKVTMVDGSTPTFTAIPVGTILPICVKVAWSTGSTATNVVALY